MHRMCVNEVANNNKKLSEEQTINCINIKFAFELYIYNYFTGKRFLSRAYTDV